MIRIVLDRLYLFAGYAAGGFMVLIFILMMVLSWPGAWRRWPSSGSPTPSDPAR
jgi:hypothetical protein